MSMDQEHEPEYSVSMCINIEMRGGKLDVSDLRDGVYFAIRKAVSLNYLTEKRDAPSVVSFDVRVVSRFESNRPLPSPALLPRTSNPGSR